MEPIQLSTKGPPGGHTILRGPRTSPSRLRARSKPARMPGGYHSFIYRPPNHHPSALRDGLWLAQALDVRSVRPPPAASISAEGSARVGSGDRGLQGRRADFNTVSTAGVRQCLPAPYRNSSDGVALRCRGLEHLEQMPRRWIVCLAKPEHGDQHGVVAVPDDKPRCSPGHKHRRHRL